MSHMYMLFEHASGYALFRVKEFEEIGAFVAQVEKSVLDLSKFNSVVKLIAFAPFSSGLYANLNAAETDVKARSAYGDNLDRLVEVKTKYDPKNLFHLNPNIVPRA